MCGIAACFDTVHSWSEPLVRMMLFRQQHRGFSHDEIFASESFALGANRLPIVSPMTGRQPLANEDSSVRVVFNGEIYNHNKLRKILGACGHIFTTDTDTEVLVHAYEEWGVDFCSRLDGMFAFVLYDERRRTRLIARDPFGVKPIYYGNGPLGFFVASECKPLLSLVNTCNLLAPGHYMLNDQIHRYYSPRRLRTFSGDIGAASDVLLPLVRDAVKKRIPDGELPMAVFLSGGVDSSLILALAAIENCNVTAISAGFEGSHELKVAREFCASLGVRHVVVEFDFEDLLSCYEEVVFHLESFEPNLVRASLITYYLCHEAQKFGFRVAMAGEGADEQFAGYKDFETLTLDKIEVKSHELFADLHRTQLMRWDRIGMRHTVEVRTPFMDRAVVEFAQSLPSAFKIRHENGLSQTKVVLREAARGLVPENIRLRDKVPMDEGVIMGGRTAWESLWERYWEQIEPPLVPDHVKEKFCLRTTEELINFNLLCKVLPQSMISSSRIKVRSQ